MNEKTTDGRAISVLKSWKINRFALLNFKIFWGQCSQTYILGRGYGAPPQTPSPSALRRLAPSAPPSSLSLCVVDILRYFRPCHGQFRSPSADLQYKAIYR